MIQHATKNRNPQFPRFFYQWQSIRASIETTYKWGLPVHHELVQYFLCSCCRRQKRWADRVAVGPAYVCADCQNVTAEHVVMRERALWQEVRGG